VNVVRYFPTQALGFSFKDYFNFRFHGISFSTDPKFSYLITRVLSGGCAGIATTIFVHPLDYARTRIGVDLGKSFEERQFTGLNDCLKKTYVKEGIPGLYRGFAISIPSIFLYRGLYFGIYDYIRDIHL
jgi:solute carrier family 25 (adenine nucleotide translocator) protein 4/5/6/31